MKLLKMLLLGLVILSSEQSFSTTKKNIQFNQLPIAFSQSIREVQRLYQDRDGYIWIATVNGLYQYDGYQLKSFKSNLHTPNYISNNNIHSIMEDYDSNLWIGTSNGLNILDKKTGNITKANTNIFDNNYISSMTITDDKTMIIGSDQGLFYYDKKDKDFHLITWKSDRGSMPRTSVQSLLKDSRGDIWIGTWSEGLFRYNPKEKKLYEYNIDTRNSAHTLFEDSKGRLWVGTWESGLYLLENKYDMSNLKWTHISEQNSSKNLVDNIIYAISEDPYSQRIWVGTRSGLSIIHDNTGNEKRFSIINHKAGSENDIPYNEVNAILRDHSGMMWLGMLGGGIYTINTQKSFFETNKLTEVRKELSSNSVRSILLDNDNVLWMGIGSYGLVSYDRNNKETKLYTKESSIFDRKVTSTINDIIQSNKNKKLYFATYREGLVIYDKKNQTIENLTIQNSKLQNDCINAIKEDRKDNIWLGTKSGINVLVNKTLIPINNIKIDKENATNYNYQTIEDDREGNIWLGTDNNGIIKISGDVYSIHNLSFTSYNIEKGSLVSNSIQCIFRDSRNRLWAGTEGGGLSLYDKEKDVFIPVNNMYNIAGDAVYSIQEDDRGSLWMGTDMGLLKLSIGANPDQFKIRFYTEEDGLQGNLFLRNVSCKSQNGEMFFGGHSGYSNFYPNEITDPKITFPVVINDIKIFNKSLSSFDESSRNRISKFSPNFTHEIKLNYKENNFSIEFSALNYFNATKTKYAYFLEGFDTEWQYTDATRRFAYYNNLQSGTYTFKVRAIGEAGTWIERSTPLKIVVLPPPWATWWAYLLYFAIICCGTYMVMRNLKNRIKLRDQLKAREMQQTKMEEVNHAKLQFFTNITHELLTPLTVTSAALEELKIVSPKHKEFYVVMENNINRLIRLLQQILEFRKAETGNLKLKVSKGDLASFVKQGVESFQPLMKKKNIHFSIICNPDSMPAYFDTDKVDKMLYNLLSNASKYNNENGFVQVNLSYGESKDEAILSVKDNGQGISVEDQKNLFKRFYEGDYRKFKTIGTGIGLSLTKDLVELHNGTISVESEYGNGTCFAITIPIDRSFYKEEEIDDDSCFMEESIPVQKETNDDIEEKSIEERLAKKDKTILLIEDNEDLLQLMTRLLNYEYNVITAQNGKEGLEVVENENIDLVVSDVMMPEMDGIEFCKAVKNNFDICHIPIILLTAKNKEEDRVDAYDSGAEGFLTKPFNLSVLHAKIKNLLRGKERTAKDFKNQIVFEAKEMDYTSIDEEFLKRAVDCVHQHLSNIEFDHQQFMQEMGASKSTLYRKLKSLTGLNTSAFIRNIRLKAACTIIEESNNIRISELAYAVGFNDPKYFSACFKKEFGMLPSEYIDRYSDDKLDKKANDVT